MPLRYVGSSPITFVSIGLEVQPGDEFSVPEEDIPAYATRSDIVVVEDPAPVVKKTSKARIQAAEEPVTVDEPVSTEESAADVEPNVS